jgi:hypothetical protein
LVLLFAGSWSSVGSGSPLGGWWETPGDAAANQYALALTRWLVLEEGARSLDDLWRIWCSSEAGIHYIKLTLADGQREWAEVPLTHRHPEQGKVLEAGNCGVLELRCKACGRRTRTVRRNCLRGMNCPCLSDDRLFGILCELLVEGWMAAGTRGSKADLSPSTTSLTAAAKTSS